MDSGLTDIILALVFVAIITIAETVSPESRKFRHDLSSAYTQRLPKLFQRASRYQAKNEEEFFKVFNPYIAPFLKFFLYGLLGYGWIEFTVSLVPIIQYRNPLIVLNCVVVVLMFLLDCVVSAKRLIRTRLFSKWNERSVFLFKKFIPLLLLVAYAVALPQICYSIPTS